MLYTYSRTLKGPPGPTGPQGIQGPTGPQGLAGSPIVPSFAWTNNGTVLNVSVPGYEDIGWNSNDLTPPPAFIWVGEWYGGENWPYEPPQAVGYSGSVWLCQIAHETPQPPSLDSNYWDLFLSAGPTGPAGPIGSGLTFEWAGTQLGVKAWGDLEYTYSDSLAGVRWSGIWNNLTSYYPRDLVLVSGEGSIYLCLLQNTDRYPTDDQTRWALFARGGGNLEYKWRGTELGVREQYSNLEYTYTDLGSSVLNLTYINTHLEADIALEQADTYYTLGVALLTSGTWFVNGFATIYSSGAQTPINVVANFGTPEYTPYAQTQTTLIDLDETTVNLSISTMIELSASELVSFYIRATSGYSNCLVKASTPNYNDIDAHATIFNAIKVVR